jgi:DNA-binding transcriptional LysR family regulator
MTNHSGQFSDIRTGADAVFEDLTSLRIFVQTVELGSFSEVARRLDVTPAMVSKRIAALEGRLQQRLLNRNTRGLFVTEAGQRLYEHCVRALRELDQAAAEISDLQDQPTGHLRITAPSVLGSVRIAPRLPIFMKQYPGLTLDVNFSLDKLDLFQQRIDVAVRIADVIDPGLVAIKLAPYRRVFCASPEYLAAHGVPKTPEDLIHHNCLISRGSTPNKQWPIKRGNDISHVQVSGTLTTDSAELTRASTRAGLGISMTARWLVESELNDGALVELLPEFTPHNRAIYAVLIQRTDSSRKLSSMVEFLKECFADLH